MPKVIDWLKRTFLFTEKPLTSYREKKIICGGKEFLLVCQWEDNSEYIHGKIRIFAGEKKGEIFGHIDFAGHGPKCYLNLIEVYERFRNRGLGTHLLNFLEETVQHFNEVSGKRLTQITGKISPMDFDRRSLLYHFYVEKNRYKMPEKVQMNRCGKFYKDV